LNLPVGYFDLADNLIARNACGMKGNASLGTSIAAVLGWRTRVPAKVATGYRTLTCDWHCGCKARWWPGGSFHQRKL